MKRYGFPLAQVLRVRRIEEDRAAAGLAAARAEVEAAAGAVGARTSDLGDCGMPPAGAAVGFAHWAERVTRAGGALTLATGAKLAADAELAARRAVWADAARRVAALERLDERRRALHRREAQRDETAAADDLVTTRRSRR